MNLIEMSCRVTVSPAEAAFVTAPDLSKVETLESLKSENRTELLKLNRDVVLARHEWF